MFIKVIGIITRQAALIGLALERPEGTFLEELKEKTRQALGQAEFDRIADQSEALPLENWRRS